MSGNEKQPLVPRLRFPDFYDDQPWIFQPLGKLAKRSTHKNSDGEIIRVLTNSAEFGVIDQRDFFDKDIANQGNLEGYYIVEEGDYVYNPRISARAPVGPVSKNRIGLGVMSPLYTVFRFNSSLNDFYAHYFKSTHWHHYMRQASSTGARHDRMSITNDDFMRLPLPVSNPGEQQKIADCLSSLDDLIAAETQKLGTLKTHKKGLMQQLFPREGETVPRLRFPEFRDAGEWEKVSLQRLIEIASGQVDPTKAPYCDLPHVGGENIEADTGNLLGLRTAREDGVISGKYAFDEHDILYSKIRPTLNKVAAPNFSGVCSADVYPIRPCSDMLRREFLVYLFRSESFVKYATKHSGRGKIPKINREDLFAYDAMLPTLTEQECIASFLSSLDERINLQSKKLEDLQRHKVGLMQQLFPVLDEVPA
ncbi:restriction endonuclease subunit S [Vibrio cholerae]